MNTPTVTATRLFPSDTTHPRGAVIVCPHCGLRHFINVDLCAPVHECPKTGRPYTLLLGGGQ